MLSEALAALRTALAGTEDSDGDWPARANNLAGVLVRMGRSGEDTLAEAIELFRRAVARSAGTPDHALYSANLARALMAADEVPPAPELADEIAERMRDAVVEARGSSTETVLGAGLAWGRWAAHASRPAEADEAFAAAASAAQELFRVQTLRSHRRSWLRAAGDVHALATAAASDPAVNDLRRAVVTMERGRALLLSEKLQSSLRAVDRLGRVGHADLAERFRTAADALGRTTRIAGAPRDLAMMDPVDVYG